MTEKIVVALGGNSITRPGEPGTIPQQFDHTSETLAYLKPIFHRGCGLAITHGNGPQIGNILIRVEEGERRVPRLPLDTCVSDSQGGMGYMIQRLACEMFRREGIRRGVVTLITQVLVNSEDADFQHPTKPIGPFYSVEEARRWREERPHWLIAEVEPGRFRRVVPSPRPIGIMEEDSIAELVDAGVVVIACGGGGIPVAWRNDRLMGVEGVIDKDLASSMLATQIRAHRLIIVTSVPHVSLHFGKAGERPLGNLTAAEARRHLEAGEFPAGSMGPKIEAGIEFIERGGEECIITNAASAAAALDGHAGTHILASWSEGSLPLAEERA